MVEKFNLETIRIPVRQRRGRAQSAADAVSAKRTLSGHLMSLRIGFVVFDVEHDEYLSGR